MKNGVKTTYIPLFATKRGSHNTGAAAFPNSRLILRGSAEQKGEALVDKELLLATHD